LFAYCSVLCKAAEELVEDPWVRRRPVRRHLDRHHSGGQCPVEKRPSSGQIASGRQPDVYDLPGLVDCPVQVRPPTVDLDVGLVDEPAVTRHVTARPRSLDELRGEPLNPPVDRDVIDVHSPLGKQLLDVTIGQAVPQVPPHRHRDHLARKPETSERGPTEMS